MLWGWLLGILIEFPWSPRGVLLTLWGNHGRSPRGLQESSRVPQEPIQSTRNKINFVAGALGTSWKPFRMFSVKLYQQIQGGGVLRRCCVFFHEKTTSAQNRCFTAPDGAGGVQDASRRPRGAPRQPKRAQWLRSGTDFNEISSRRALARHQDNPRTPRRSGNQGSPKFQNF